MTVDVASRGPGPDGLVVDRARRARLTRMVIGYGVVAAVLPYLSLRCCGSAG
ncbi:hypothetical protein ACLQ29_08685 [Micromonospora sp. DT228]|uniref:hypothetical protein n=1 Tax=Micromonospora sp. DT228 TaxID=3393443 RepID=UPI003CF5CFE7